VIQVKVIGFVVVLALAAAAVPAVGAGAPAPDTPRAQAAARQFEGTVVAVNRDARRFRLRDVERGTVTIKVTRNTRFERIDGLAGLKVGMRMVESIVRRSNGAWIALEVERSGGGGEHGGRGNWGGSGPGG
jgi:Domain of unknown function (DUF5666)